MADEAVVFKKKARARPEGVRKRTLAEDEAANGAATTTTAGSEVVVKQRQLGGNPLRQGTAGTGQKRRKVEAVESSEDEDEGVSRVGVAYGVAGSARALATSRRSRSPDPTAPTATATRKDEDGPENEGLYKGATSAKHQLPKGGARFGPVKGPANVRTITLTDYQPDICKDYKETGFCGFGDTCKFLHDRSDYLHGWQMDSAFAASRSGPAQPEEEEEEEIPFACLICRKPFTDPVVTKCGHYFCSACAIKRFARNPKCFACGAATGGIFNKAQRILDKMRKKKEAAEAAKAAREADDDDLDGIEGLQDLGRADDDDHPAVVDPDRPQYGDAEGEGSERSFYEDE